MQKIRLVLRGWSRRREQRQEEFLRRNSGWGAVPSAAPPPAAARAAEVSGPAPKSIDLEGLQAAYLDTSGLIAYFLDIESGEVVESRDGSTLDDTRYKRVPTRGERSENDDRRAFIDGLEPSAMKQSLMKNVASTAFRSVLAGDRGAERAWYNFRNDRATAAIGQWLKSLGLR